MRAAFVIAAKDLSQRIRDRSAILLGLVAPLGLALIFSAIIPDVGESFDVSLAYVDQDGGQVSSGFINGVLPDIEANAVATVEGYTDLEMALEDTEAGTIHALYVFPAGVSEAVTSGPGGTVRLVGNVDQSNSPQMSQAILDGYLAEIDAVTMAVGASLVNGAEDPAALAAAAAQQPAAVILVDTEAADRQLDATTFFSAGMAVFFLFFTVQFGFF